jgi:hypothetical protein
MGCSKEKEEIEARVVGIGVDVKPDWCTGRSVLAGDCLVVCWWSGRNQCKWVGKSWLWVGIVEGRWGVVIVQLVTCPSLVILVEFVSEWLKA